MFNFSNNLHATDLDQRITKLLEELNALDGDSKEYTIATNNLAKLMELRNQIIKTGNESTKIDNDRVKVEFDLSTQNTKDDLERERLELDRDKLRLDKEKFHADVDRDRSWKPSTDAMLGAAASVVGILLVLHYEKMNVITSKAFGFVGKMK